MKAAAEYLLVTLGVLIGLAAGKAIWKEEKVPPHGSLINTNHEVLLPSTQHLIAQLAKIDRDLELLSFLVTVKNAPTNYTTHWTNSTVSTNVMFQTNTFVWMTNVADIAINATSNFIIQFPTRSKIKWGGQATNSP